MKPVALKERHETYGVERGRAIRIGKSCTVVSGFAQLVRVLGRDRHDPSHSHGVNERVPRVLRSLKGENQIGAAFGAG